MDNGGVSACITSCLYNARTGSVQLEDAYFYINVDGGEASSFINFYEDGSAVGEYIGWVDNQDRFEISDSIHFFGDMSASGTKNFVQIHPGDPTKALRYATLEGPEVGVYWRGSGQLTNGIATIVFPEEFALALDPLGALTAQVTLTADANGLFVVEKALTHIVVKEVGGGLSDATFDFQVNGVRDGYADYDVIVPNEYGLTPGLRPWEQEAPSQGIPLVPAN